MVDAVSEARHAATSASGTATTDRRDPGGIMPTVLTHLLMAERKKRRCLSVIAKAPVATIGRGEVAEKLRTFAAESLAVVGRNIIELEILREGG